MRNTVGAVRAIPLLRSIAGGMVAALLTLFVAGFAMWAAGEDIEVTGVDVRIVEEEAVGVGGRIQGKAIVGDLLHVRAAVRNNSAQQVERLQVDFYFTEQITREHGLIGTQTVRTLGPGEERLPAITVATNGFTPGLYAFTAVIVRESGGAAASGLTYGLYTQGDDELVSILSEGPHISELGLAEAFEFCQIGSIDPVLEFELSNFGTVNLGVNNLSFTVSARSSIGSSAVSQTLDLQLPLFLPIQPAQKASVKLEPDYSVLEQFSPKGEDVRRFGVLGEKSGDDVLFLDVTVTPSFGDQDGSPRVMTLPSETKGARVYSQVDLWTFPERAECECSDNCSERSAPVPPIVVGSGFAQVAYHVTREGDVATGVYRLHIISLVNGRSLASVTLSDPIVTSPVVLLAEEGSVVVEGTEAELQTFTYYAFVGTASGIVQAYRVVETKEEGDVSTYATETSPAWQTASGYVSGLDTSGSPTSVLALTSADGTVEGSPSPKLLVGSPEGLFVLDAITGTQEHALKTYANLGLQGQTSLSVAAGPLFAHDRIWIAVGRDVLAVSVGEEQVSAVQLTAGATISTPLVFSSPTGVLFCADQFGSVYAIAEGTTPTIAGTLVDRSGQSLVGIAIGEDVQQQGAEVLSIYVTNAAGVVRSIEYRAGHGFQGAVQSSDDLRIAGKDDDALSGQGQTWDYYTLLANSTNASPAYLFVEDDEAGGDKEHVFLAARFLRQVLNVDRNDAELLSDQAIRYGLIGLNATLEGTSVVRRIRTWGKNVQFVFLLPDIDAGSEPLLAPIVGEEFRTAAGTQVLPLLAVAPDGRLYAFNALGLNSDGAD